MPRTDLAFLDDRDYSIPQNFDPRPTVIYEPRPVEQKYSNPFEDLIKAKLKSDFGEFITASENAKVDHRVRELERSGLITVHWDKLNRSSDADGSAKSGEFTLSPKAKAFWAGFGLGIIAAFVIL
jgi:hypothetical protein